MGLHLLRDSLMFFKIAEKGMLITSQSLNFTLLKPHVCKVCALLVHPAVLWCFNDTMRHSFKHLFQVTTMLNLG